MRECSIHIATKDGRRIVAIIEEVARVMDGEEEGGYSITVAKETEMPE